MKKYLEYLKCLKYLKSSKRLKYLKYIISLFLSVYILLLTVPYVSHKEISREARQKIQKKEYYSDVTGTERVSYIDDNMDALLFRLNMIQNAKEEIILSTFDFNPDESGKDIMAALISAADRGVTVSVLIDGISGMLDASGNPWFQALASHDNITLKIYNPVSLLKPWKVQARLHDKYLIVDETMFLLGGRNTFNLFLGDYSPKKNIDRELFIYETGENPEASIFQLKEYFQSVWNHPDSKTFSGTRQKEKTAQSFQWLCEHSKELPKLFPQSYEPWDYESLTLPTNKITLLHNPIEPENKEPWMWHSLLSLMETGSHITIYTPYIICGKEMYADLASLCEKADLVEIITNGVENGANPWGCTDYLNQKENIWETGVRVHEYLGSHSLHTKAVLVDDRMTVIGSYNLDMRSTYQDTELMLAVDSSQLNSILQAEAEELISNSRYMAEDGSYIPGENYAPREMSAAKKILYTALRFLIIPFRRFL